MSTCFAYLQNNLDNGDADRIALARIVEFRKNIDTRLAELISAMYVSERKEQDPIVDAIRFGVLAPGKRTRPLLMLLVGRGLGKPADGALLDIACAVEMVHTASLFLDDLPCMDNARLRRGRPCIHARFGEDVAILASVALLSQAWRIAVNLNGISPSVRNQLVLVLCNTLGLEGLVRGQYRDLREGVNPRAAKDIVEGNHQKTGALFEAALQLTGLVCGVTDETLKLFRNVTFELGQAFQLRDDLEDGAPEAEQVAAKDHYKDEGKSTLVTLLGRDSAANQLEQHVQRVKKCLTPLLVHDTMALWLLERTFEKNPCMDLMHPA